MAIELPYFRFEVQSWQNGDISLEPYESQGLFISICSFYWSKDCSVTLALLQRRYSSAREVELIEKMIVLNILKHEKRHDKIEIVFLNNQYDLLSEERKRRQVAGSMGGKAKAKLKQSSSYKIRKEKIIIDKKRKEDLILIYPFESENFKKYWQVWKNYKQQQHGFSYKSAITEQASLKEISELSKSNEELAIKIINQSIDKGWKGLFELKINSNNGTHKKGKQEEFANYFREKSQKSGNAS